MEHRFLVSENSRLGISVFFYTGIFGCRPMSLDSIGDILKENPKKVYVADEEAAIQIAEQAPWMIPILLEQAERRAKRTLSPFKRWSYKQLRGLRTTDRLIMLTRIYLGQHWVPMWDWRHIKLRECTWLEWHRWLPTISKRYPDGMDEKYLGKNL